MTFSKTLAISALLGSAAAYPFAGLSVRQADANSTSSGGSTSSSSNSTDGSHAFAAPGPNDSRGPCPALNTLANHGYISRDGRNMTADMILNGFSDGFGVAQSAVLTPLQNFYNLCEYVEGSPCATLTNLTLLAEPHAFEHEHSLAREDYHMAYGNGAVNDNNNFNGTVFGGSLAALPPNATHMDFQGAQQVRLERESFSLGQDYPGWFIEARDLALTDMGWVFAVMQDPSLNDSATNPQVRVDWWRYWFANESLPTELGWSKPNPPVGADFVSSVSSMVEHAPVTSTPSPLPAVALSSVSFGQVSASPNTTLTTVFAVPTDAQNVQAGGPSIAVPAATTSAPATTTAALTGSAAAAASSLNAFHMKLASLESSLGAEPTAYNMYIEVVSPQVIAAQVNARQARLETVQSVLSATETGSASSAAATSGAASSSIAATASSAASSAAASSSS